jgi:hypothetical protein
MRSPCSWRLCLAHAVPSPLVERLARLDAQQLQIVEVVVAAIERGVV